MLAFRRSICIHCLQTIIFIGRLRTTRCRVCITDIQGIESIAPEFGRRGILGSLMGIGGGVVRESTRERIRIGGLRSHVDNFQFGELKIEGQQLRH